MPAAAATRPSRATGKSIRSRAVPRKSGASTKSTGGPGPGAVRVGVGGWVFEPWRDNFYPAGLVQRRELEYASRKLATIEINGTFYRAQQPSTYARWRDEVPDGFVFSAKAPMRIVSARDLARTGRQVQDFIGGITALGDTLGPLVWQFDNGPEPARGAFESFLDLLPAEQEGRRIRHVIDMRHPGFVDAWFIDQVRRRGLATVFTDSDEHPSFADLTADFVYARLMRSQDRLAAGYALPSLRQWAARARQWAAGQEPAGLPRIQAGPVAAPRPRDVFVYFIGSAKRRNPAAAMKLLAELARP